MRCKHLVFSHIPKTAGTSVRNGLLDGFKAIGENFNDYGVYNHGDWIRPTALPMLALPETSSFIYGHVTARDLASNRTLINSGESVLFLSFVRDPIERLLSMYNFISVTVRHQLHTECIETDPIEFFFQLSERYRNQHQKYLECDPSVGWKFLVATNSRVGQTCAEAFEMVTGNNLTAESFDRTLNVARESVPTGKAKKLTKSMLTKSELAELYDTHSIDMDIYELVKSREVLMDNPIWHLR